MNADDLKTILAKHLAWIHGERDGKQADLSGADLSRANLSRVDLSWVDLSWVDLSWANLSEANLSRANLSRANLSRADLSGAYLSRADLYGAYLYGANLSGADLSRANLSRANLSGADLSRAYLYGANLSEANLSRANLSRANLSGADLSGAYLPKEMSIEDWCNAHDLATLPDGRRVAFKRLDASMTTGQGYGQTTTWKRRAYVEAADWNDAQECGGGLHLSPTPQASHSYSSGGICVPVAFDIKDAVHIGDKLKVRKCQVL